MPTLRDLMAIVCRHAESRGLSFGEQGARELEAEIRRAFPAERVYIPPADSRKDPGRAEAIRQAAKRLPTGVAAERFGVSVSWVHRVTKK